jgi:hypothetical protein
MPLYIMAILFLVFNFFRNTVWKVIAFVIPVLKIGNFQMDENLPNYYTALDEEDRDWIIKEEENCRLALKFNVLLDETLKKFKNTKMGKKTMSGTPCYDILGNINYMDDFQYFSPAIEDRCKFIIDDDEDETNDTA